MPPITVPPFLCPGDTVGVLAPASRVRYDDCIPGLEVLRDQWGLRVREAPTLRGGYFQFSGPDEQRLAELQGMLDDPNLRAILAARGGYGCSRLLDRLDFTAFRQSPKWLVGFSDLTALLSHLNSLGYAALHGPMVKTMANAGGERALGSLRGVLFGQPVRYEVPDHPLNRPGKGRGPVTGGNLCLLAHLTGSPSAVDAAGKILFIEDINEYLYNIDRMMIQLDRAGHFKNLAGLVVGQFTDSRDNPEPTFGKTAYEIIAERVAKYPFPVCFDFPVGHVAENYPLPVGPQATLEVGKSGAVLAYEPMAQAV